jgi:hypothetical protein
MANTNPTPTPEIAPIAGRLSCEIFHLCFRSKFKRWHDPSCITSTSAEEFGLKFQRHVANLIQKESAPIRHLKSTLGLCARACESASFVAEQFAVQQSAWNRRAVEGTDHSSPAQRRPPRTERESSCRPRPSKSYPSGQERYDDLSPPRRSALPARQCSLCRSGRLG